MIVQSLPSIDSMIQVCRRYACQFERLSKNTIFLFDVCKQMNRFASQFQMKKKMQVTWRHKRGALETETLEMNALSNIRCVNSWWIWHFKVSISILLSAVCFCAVYRYVSSTAHQDIFIDGKDKKKSKVIRSPKTITGFIAIIKFGKYLSRNTIKVCCFHSFRWSFLLCFWFLFYWWYDDMDWSKRARNQH